MTISLRLSQSSARGDMLSAGGSCELASVTHFKCVRGKFRQMLPLLTNGNLSLLTRGRVHSTCLKSVMRAAENNAITMVTLNRLCINDCSVCRFDLFCQGKG